MGSNVEVHAGINSSNESTWNMKVVLLSGGCTVSWNYVLRVVVVRFSEGMEAGRGPALGILKSGWCKIVHWQILCNIELYFVATSGIYG